MVRRNTENFSKGEQIVIPKQNYAVFRTEKQRRPISDYIDIRKRIVTEWLPSTNYTLMEGAEIVALKWRPHNDPDWKNKKYIQIELPIKTK